MEQKNSSPILRVMTLNIWNTQGPYEKRLPLIIQGLQELSPDIVGLQEVVDKSDKGPNQAEYIASQLGYQYTFQGCTQHKHGLEGIAILSRYPILKKDAMQLPFPSLEETRYVIHALIETPFTQLNFYNTHLCWKLDEGYKREAQVVGIHKFIKKQTEGFPVIVTGDFNARPDSAEIMFFTGRHAMNGESAYYQDTWERIHDKEEGYSWSAKNTFTREWLEPNRRIDYVFTSQPTREGKGLTLDSRLVLNRPDSEGTFPTDHFGVFAEIRY